MGRHFDSAPLRFAPVFDMSSTWQAGSSTKVLAFSGLEHFEVFEKAKTTGSRFAVVKIGGGLFTAKGAKGANLLRQGYVTGQRT
jgi:hypothetical protein